jgi:hypothetical protein
MVPPLASQPNRPFGFPILGTAAPAAKSVPGTDLVEVSLQSRARQQADYYAHT